MELGGGKPIPVLAPGEHGSQRDGGGEGRRRRGPGGVLRRRRRRRRGGRKLVVVVVWHGPVWFVCSVGVWVEGGAESGRT